MAETTALPTTDNTVAEIKAYLDAAGISYSSSSTKSELLALIPGDEAEAQEAAAEEAASASPASPAEPAPQQAPQEPYYTKAELLDLVGGRTHDYFLIALKNDRNYTYKEALQAVDDWKHSGTIF
jgi:hypothetical protein